MSDIRRDEDVLVYLDQLRMLIENRHIDHYKVRLISFVKYYRKFCKTDDDHNLVQEIENIMCAADTEDLALQEEREEKLWSFLKDLFLIVLKIHPTSSLLRTYVGFVWQEKLLNKWKALFNHYRARCLEPTVMEEFAIYRYEQTIEREMKETDLSWSESSGMYVTDMVDFADKFAIFTLTIEKAVVYHYDFWRELLEPTPEILKLDLLAMKITNIIVHIENLYKELILLNPNNIKCNLLYGEFQKQILNDENSQELIDKALALQKNQ